MSSVTRGSTRQTLTVLLEAVLVAEERPGDSQPWTRSVSRRSPSHADTSDRPAVPPPPSMRRTTHFLQLGHSRRLASFSPQPAHLDMMPRNKGRGQWVVVVGGRVVIQYEDGAAPSIVFSTASARRGRYAFDAYDKE